MKEHATAFIKIVKVIESCETTQHMDIAIKIIDCYRDFYMPTKKFSTEYLEHMNRLHKLRMISLEKSLDLTDLMD